MDFHKFFWYNEGKRSAEITWVLPEGSLPQSPYGRQLPHLREPFEISNCLQ